MFLNNSKTITLIIYSIILHSLSICNCVHINDCTTFELLVNHPQTEEQNFYDLLLHNAACYYRGPNLLVCCQIHGMGIMTTTEMESWIWGSRPHRAEERQTIVERLKFKPNVADFDPTPQTYRNYPPVVYGTATHDEEEEKDNEEEYPYKSHQYSSSNRQHEYESEDAATVGLNDGLDIDNAASFVVQHKPTRPYGAKGTTGQPEKATSILFPENKQLNNPTTFALETNTVNRLVPQLNDSVPTPVTMAHYDSGWPTRLIKVMATTTEAPAIRQLNITRDANRISFVNSVNCGISIGRRIIGGIEAQSGQFPWIIKLGYINTTSNRLSYRCSGSIITKQYILTAAHCVTKLVTNLKLHHVLIGDKEVTANCLENACHTDQMHTIAKIIIHDKYDSPKYAHDIALLRINRSSPAEIFNSTENYDSICLPACNNSSFVFDEQSVKTGVVAGWSTNKDGVEIATSTSIKYLRLPIVNTTECALKYAQYSENLKDAIVITPSQLCAQGQPTSDVCRGDSGGPFMDDGTSGVINTNGRYTLLGIVAFGPTICGASNLPGVYIRVSSYLDWIVGNINQSV